MLDRSSRSKEAGLDSIINCTKAILFLGTPHRGSPDFASAGDWARSIVSAFGAETTPEMLNALGLRNTDLERAQESFSDLWHHHGFHVKTFKEGLGLTGIHLGVLGDKVVPDYSSIIGDARERAETIQANHRDMCRFTGAEDPGYQKVSGELRSIYLSIMEKDLEQELVPALEPEAEPKLPKRAVDGGLGGNAASEREILVESGAVMSSVDSFDLRQSKTNPFTPSEKAYLQSLWYKNMNSRHKELTRPTDGTCNWLFENETYQKWVNGQDRRYLYGLLQIKGLPGCGKSVLMKEACRRVLPQHTSSGHWIAAFFFDGKGKELQHSRAGLLRSLLYQLMPQCRGYLARTAERFVERQRGLEANSICCDGDIPLEHPAIAVQELENTLRALLLRLPPGKKAFIFIDALDECDREDVHQVIYFWGDYLRAYMSKVDLNVLISSRDYPSIMVGSYPQIEVSKHNRGDIATYIGRRLEISIAAQEPGWRTLRALISDKAGGVFLWAVLAVDRVIERWMLGEGIPALRYELHILPSELHDLFSALFTPMAPETADLTIRLLQWAILSTRPLQLLEWHHILAFIRRPAPQSLKAWRESKHFTSTDAQLEREIRALSRGLLEVAVDEGEEYDTAESLEHASEFAGAGSFMMNPGGTRVVQVIHQSVRDFFLSGGGFCLLLDGFSAADKLVLGSVNAGHFEIVTTCLDYLNMPELDTLVEARVKATAKATERRLLIDQDQETRSRSPVSSWPGFPSPVLSSRSLVSSTNPLVSKNEPPRPAPVSGATDVIQWVEGVREVGSHQDQSMFKSRSSITSRSLVSAKTELLEDYPALLSYAIDELLVHSRRAREFGLESTCLQSAERRAMVQQAFERLVAADTWKRYLALGEELGGRELPEFSYHARPQYTIQDLVEFFDVLRGKLEHNAAQVHVRTPPWVINEVNANHDPKAARGRTKRK